jgi:hypothetical protein
LFSFFFITTPYFDPQQHKTFKQRDYFEKQDFNPTLLYPKRCAINIAIMPLVVPGIMTNPEDKNQEWANKLVGKTFSESDESNETVSVFPIIHLSQLYSVTPLPSHTSGEICPR